MLKESDVKDLKEAKLAVQKAWQAIKVESLSVLGSELHYQAMIYHCLRVEGGVPLKQIGMNVKMWIDNPVSNLFQTLDKRKHKDFQGGFEPIPDVVIFNPAIDGDWRRRNNEKTLLNMLIAIEVKASEREKSRLQPSEIMLDIQKLAAHREEVIARGSDVFPLMLVIDSAPMKEERMTTGALEKSHELALKLGVGFLYVSPENEIYSI